MLQAADHFLSSDTAIIARPVDTNAVFYPPCGPGLLLCAPIYCRTPENKYFTYSHARTWISDAMVKRGQLPLAAATDVMGSQLLYLIAVAGS